MADSISSEALPINDYPRYGRQMILDGFGLSGQLKLRNASVAVVGAGGLGCPALQYLAAAGVGKIRVIDPDRVDLSNLQRQILHGESSIGEFKAISAKQALRRLNSGVDVETINVAIDPSNAVALLSHCDIILDCCDNSPTRYLLSDVAVMLGKPLVSGAAQRYDGQLSVYNLANGPCYRCLFPKPPAPEFAGSCAELGILGVVTGVVGNLQALEAIKILIGQHDLQPSLLLFSALTNPSFRTIKLRARKKDCVACSSKSQDLLQIHNFDYVQFCGGETQNWEERGLEHASRDTRINAEALKLVFESGQNVRLIDVRPATEFDICKLPGSLNIPLKTLVANPELHAPEDHTMPVVVVCRLGNDSQIAAQALLQADHRLQVKDLVGGLKAWTKKVDQSFPIY